MINHARHLFRGEGCHWFVVSYLGRNACEMLVTEETMKDLRPVLQTEQGTNYNDLELPGAGDLVFAPHPTFSRSSTPTHRDSTAANMTATGAA